MPIAIHPPAPPVDPQRFALFDLGFRPLYLLAGAYAALSVPIWALQYAGWLPLVPPAATLAATLVSALLWCAAFTPFVVAYAPILSRPRLDGAPG